MSADPSMPAPAADPVRIALTLASHTNVGKTTLARTLLRRDIGEVRDEAHVTQSAERHVLIESSAGDRLELWDTPGFGDSVRLARRLSQAGHPIGWFLSEVWDRFRDRAFWSSQRAIRAVVDEADVVLYLVQAGDAADPPGHLEPELKVLDLLGKPVLVLLNQIGRPQEAALEADERQRWQALLRRLAGPCVRDVLALDAFARCWVQEETLLDAVAAVLPADRQAGFARLQDAWRQRALAAWSASVEVMAAQLATIAADREPLPASSLPATLRAAGAALGLRGGSDADPRERAMQRLAERWQQAVRRSTDHLIGLHGLDGRAADVVLERVAGSYALDAPLSEGKAALWGGVLTGALAGLKADLATGGLTLGGGLLAGSLLGALGAAGLARGFNLVRGNGSSSMAWSDAALVAAARDTLLRYLAVAHYGRGRGRWSEGEHPPFWAGEVEAALQRHAALWRSAWGAVRRSADAGAATRGDARIAVATADPGGPHPGAAVPAELRQAVDRTGRDLLARLYPRSSALAGLDPTP
jgi:hypothetical protein